MKKILFIDRDGTLIQEDWKGNQQIDHINKYRWLPNCISNLAKLAKEGNYTLVMVTNQDGLGKDFFPESDFYAVQNHIMDTMASEGIQWKEVCIDRSFPEENFSTRKPGTGMVDHYRTPEWDLENSFVLGDRDSDMQLAKNMGCKGIFMGKEEEWTGKGEFSWKITNWNKIYQFLKEKKRNIIINRNTSETKIRVEYNPDGSGVCEIATGIPFFDHMLEQIGRHSGADLSIQCTGDLHIDDHHTIEDVALSLGQAVREAVANKVGMQRYSFHLPMDESDARVLMDLGGRPAFKFNAEFKREMVGDLATENVSHFFKSFSDAAACNLHMEVQGENEHHKIEALFKAFARALGMAVTLNSEGIASTKGVI